MVRFKLTISFELVLQTSGLITHPHLLVIVQVIGIEPTLIPVWKTGAPPLMRYLQIVI